MELNSKNVGIAKTEIDLIYEIFEKKGQAKQYEWDRNRTRTALEAVRVRSSPLRKQRLTPSDVSCSHRLAQSGCWGFR
jgi:hypothetical protein